MRRILRGLGVGLAGLLTVCLFVVLGAFAASEMMLRQSYPKVPVTLVANHDAASIARGRRLATIAGCHDCHGADLGGKLFHDEPMLVRAWAPNLSLAAAHQSDADLDRAIRHGVAADGRSLWIMPSDAFSRLSDRESADLIAYIRTFAPHGQPQPALQAGPIGRVAILLGKFHSAPAILAREGDKAAPDVGPAYAQGRQLARACMECHGLDLTGGAATKAPDLMIAGAYDDADFKRLLRTGVAAGGRKVGLMSEIAPVRFNALSDQEIEALHGYLRARAERAPQV